MEISKILRRMLVTALMFCMVFTLFANVFAVGAGAQAGSALDFKGHWAEKPLSDWMGRGLIQGFEDGSMKPDNPITRAEFIALVNRAFQFSEKGTVQFNDVTASGWEFRDVAVAVKAGYIQGYADGTFGSHKQISREEAAVIISRLLNLSASAAGDTAAKGFKDSNTFAVWSKTEIGSIADRKIMLGYEDDTYKAGNPITRAEAVVTLERATASKPAVYNAAGTFGPASGTDTVSRDVVISAPGVTLQNMSIAGNLTLGEGIGEGDVNLKNVTVKGTTTIKGGGSHSVHFENSVLVSVVIDKRNGTVRIVAEGSTFVAEVTVKTAATIEELNLSSGAKGFASVKLTDALPPNSKVTLIGDFENLDVAVQNIAIDIPSGSIGKLNVAENAKDLLLNMSKNVKVLELVINAVIRVLGEGTVVKATISTKGKDTKFDKEPETKQSDSPNTSDGGDSQNNSGNNPPPSPTDAQTIELDKQALTVGYAAGDSAASVTQNVTLAGVGVHGTTVSWNSNTPGVIANNGTVTRSVYGSPDATVILTATVSKGSVSDTLPFSLTVKAETEFASGQGTSSDPYVITKASHLDHARNHLSANFSLASDIDLGVSPYNLGEGWLPIGQTKFQGSFKGNGYIIRNLYINRPTKSGGGLFAVVGETGKVDNVKLENVLVKATHNTGGLVAIIYPGGMVSNSSVTGSVLSTDLSKGGQMGGLVGYNYGGTVINCQASVTVIGKHRLGGLVGNNWGIITHSNVTVSTVTGEFLIGGLAGFNYYDGSVTSVVNAVIETSSADAIVTGTAADSLAGGLVGENAGGALKNSYAAGSVTGNKYVGGLTGRNGDFLTHPGSVENSYAANSVTGTSSMGGLVGEKLPGQVVNSYYDSQITGKSDSDRGTPKTTTEMKQSTTFTGWDPLVWTMTANQYPTLK